MIDFHLDDDEQAIQDALATLCAQHDVDTIAKAAGSEFPSELWSALCEFRLFEVGAPGSEIGLGALAAAAEQLGSALVPGPLGAGVFASSCLDGSAFEDVVSGRTVPSLSTGRYLPWPRVARVRLFTDGQTVFTLEEGEVAQELTTLGQTPFADCSGLGRSEIGDATRAILAYEIFTASYLVGGARRLLRDASEYLSHRRQFGKTLSEFQALSHPLAECAIKARAAAALIKIAARCGDAGDPDANLRSAAGFQSARDVAMTASYVAHQCFGAIGVTIDGPVFYASRRLRQIISEDPLCQQRQARLYTPSEGLPATKLQTVFSKEEEKFRSEVVDVIAKYPDANGFFSGVDKTASDRLYEGLVERNWLALGWDSSFGGRGLPPSYEFILWDEMAYARAGRPTLGAGIIAKTIMRFGTDHQKEKWLPLIRQQKVKFCLGYSEPEAGSDLSSLRTHARLDGSDYIINGQKIWTSEADTSDYVWLLCRTGEQKDRAKALTLLIVDLRAPGIEIRSGIHMDGHEYSEIFFSDVRVPSENRVGLQDRAWRMMAEALVDERHVQFMGKRVRRDFEDAVNWLRSSDRLTCSVTLPRLRELAVNVAEAEAMCLMVLADQICGADATISAAANKILHTDTIQAIARFVMDVGGAEALLCQEFESPEKLWRQTMIESIGGGTSEIMKSIIARQELGLSS